MKSLRRLAAAAALVALTGAAQAALIDRGGGMIYDSTFNITWLADMNYAATSGYAAANAGGSPSERIAADGKMAWFAAKLWADNLVYGGYSDWRLPTIDTAERTGTNGELSHLFITDLGNKAEQSVLNQTDDTLEQKANLTLFSNVQLEYYWSNRAYEDDQNSSFRYFFDASLGRRMLAFTTEDFYAVAVRPGDVTAPVPEPQTLALVLLALGATVVARRTRAR